MATRQVTNISKFVICVLAEAPSISWPQSKQETYEAAVLRLVEMAEESLGDTFRQLLSDQGRSADEIDTILFNTFHAHANCLAHVARKQAQEQNIAEKILLDALGQELQNDDPFGATFHVDIEAYGLKQQQCSDVLYEELGLRSPR